MPPRRFSRLGEGFLGQGRRALAAGALALEAEQARQGRRRARRKGHEVEPHGAHARDHGLEHRAGALRHLAALARRGRVRDGTGLGEANDAQLERGREVQLLRVGEHDLERAAAQIEQGHAPLAEVERAARAEVDEPGLLVAADDADVDAHLVARRPHELAAVLRLAHGARRHRDQRVGLVAVGDAAQELQRVERAPKHLGRDDARVQRSNRPAGPSPWRGRAPGCGRRSRRQRR